MRSFNRLALLALPFAAAVNAQLDYVCFQDCANSNYDGFPCPGLDLACYCSLDNGEFLVRLSQCIVDNCDDNTIRSYALIVDGYECPWIGDSDDSATTTVTAVVTPTGDIDNDDDNDDDDDDNDNDDDDDDDDDDGNVATLTATIPDDVVVTSTDSVTLTTSLSLIGDEFTSTIVETFVTQTIITTESDTTRTLTITASGGFGGIIDDVVTSPVSTDYTTLVNDEGSTVISAVSTFYSTYTTADEPAPTDDGNDGDDDEGSASQVKSGMFLGLAAGLVALFAM